jgi:elongator complex protein 3
MKLPKKNEIRKPTKTLSGVTPVAVMCKPKKCAHGTCVYCPTLNVPQSYTPKSPPVLRAELMKYDPYKQVQSRLKAYKLMNHPTDKIELIIMGGNFPEYPVKYKNWFIKRCYDALNSSRAWSLSGAKKRNQKAKHRCVALCIETRPDTLIINKNSIKELNNWGCTRVELGVQAIDNKIYKLVCRHHTVEDVIAATNLLRNNGFKIGYHMMLGLPGSNPKKDISMFNELFKNPDFKPDQLKIYPCQVLQGSALAKWYKQGKYKPYTKEQIQKIIIKIMSFIPRYCRVMRMMREIAPDFLIAGTTRIDLRRDIEAELKKTNTKVNEIRFREIGFALRDLEKNKKISTKLKLKTTKYKAGDSDEYFIEIINSKEILFGLCRLRLQPNTKIGMQAIIRELHVYGKSLAIGEKSIKQAIASQHKGLGKQLIKEAEKITKHHKIKDLHIISGVGVRPYYKKLGYKLMSNYMYKKFN